MRPAATKAATKIGAGSFGVRGVPRPLLPILLSVLAASPAAAQQVVAITPVTVVDVIDGSLQPDRTVLVEDHRIAAVGPAGEVTVPPHAEVVDGSGGYLVPGLWDMHAHASRDGRADRFWPLFVAHGVTGIRELGMSFIGHVPLSVSLSEASDAGVPILAGTDASGLPYIFSGSSLHDELALLVEAGLTPLEALQTATLNPARFLDRTHDFGTVEEGKLADLVLLEANPLEDIANTQRIRAVVVDGRLFSRAELDRLLAEVEESVEPDGRRE